MIFQNHYSVQGYFGFKVYNKSGELKYSSPKIKNFITSTGLSYPSVYAFADCFRFISLGSGTGVNTLLGNNGWGTTGLSQPINEFQYIGSRINYNDVTSSLYENPSCDYTENNNGLTLSRGWRIPSGSGTFDQNYSFQEFMLSPGKPTGITQQCGCQGGFANGVDASIIADYYDELGNSICNATSAFTRIIAEIDATTDDFLVVSYDLNIILNTGLKPVDVIVTQTGISSRNWSGHVRGLGNITNHGLKIINNLTGNNDPGRNQITTNFGFYDFTLEYGESFVPLWGNPLEPSSSSTNIVAYFSTDNTQFLVNNFSGGPIDTGFYKPYNPNGYPFSSGVMAYVSQSSQNNNNQIWNIRTPLGYGFFPNSDNIREGNFDGPNNFSYIGASQITRFNINPFIPSGRSRTSTYSCQFRGLNSANSGWDVPNGESQYYPRSLVFAFTDQNANGIMYPFYDIILSGISGEGLPLVNTGLFTYSSQINDYFYLENGGDLTLGLVSNWSSPCETGVIGC